MSLEVATQITTIVTAFLTLLGVGLAIYVAWVQIRDIREDQRRIALELAAKPILKIGFIDPFMISSRIKPRKTWTVSHAEEDKDLKGLLRVPIQILIRNTGKRTARDLLVNIGLPKRIVFPPIQAGASLHRSDRTNVLATTNEKPLNPGDNRGLPLTILVPNDIDQVQVDVAVSMRDQRDRKVSLTLKISKPK